MKCAGALHLGWTSVSVYTECDGACRWVAVGEAPPKRLESAQTESAPHPSKQAVHLGSLQQPSAECDHSMQVTRSVYDRPLYDAYRSQGKVLRACALPLASTVHTLCTGHAAKSERAKRGKTTKTGPEQRVRHISHIEHGV